MLEVGWWGVIKGSFQNILKQWVGKDRSCSRSSGEENDYKIAVAFKV